MAKGKRTYVALISKESKIAGYVTTINKKAQKPGQKLTLRKYDKNLRRHVEFVAKEIK